MTANGFLQVGFYLVVLIALAKPLGAFMANVYDGKRTFLDPVLRPVERLIYRVCGVDPDEGMDWKTYAVAMLLFNGLGALAVYGLQRLQGVLPLNPQGFAGVTPDSSFNTAMSFATNTNWQGYGGEATMSYLTQMLGLSVQNFVSAAAGMATLVALIRGFRNASTREIGNFWVDLTRSVLYIMLPLSIGLALVQTSQGVVQNFSAYKTVPLLQATSVTTPVKDADGNPVLDEKGEPKTETTAVTEQTLPMGPASSQVAIKQLGTNGGGFFNVNSAHPYENPTPLSNFLEVLAILVISARALLHLRPDGRRHPPGVGRARRHDRHLRRHARASASGPSTAATRATPPSAPTSRRATSSRAATWRARRCASASPTPPSGRPPPRPPRTAR